MLRALVVLVLLANVLFLAWTQGWLPPTLAPRPANQREPERLAAQVRPEIVTVVPPKATNAAVAAARAAESAGQLCMEAGPFAEADVAAAEGVLQQASLPSGTWTRDLVPAAVPWGVYMGRFADPAAYRAKQEELHRMKLGFEEVHSPPALDPGLLLSTHPDKAGAEAALAQLSQRGIRSARTVELPAAPAQTWLRVARADSEMQARLKALIGIGTGFATCQRVTP